MQTLLKIFQEFSKSYITDNTYMWYDISLKIPRSCLKPSSLFSKNGVLWNSESLSFNTAKISHHFGHENKSQKNTALPYWMKLLVVRVEKSKVCNSFLHCYSSRRRIWFASASTLHVHGQPLPASIPGKLGSKLPKVSLGRRPCKS